MKKTIITIVSFLLALTLVACEEKVKYQVTFDINGGVSSDSLVITVNENSLINPVEVTKEGFEINYWYDLETNLLWTFETKRVTKDLTLVVSWKETDGSETKPGEVVETYTTTLKYENNETTSFSSNKETNNATIVGLKSSDFLVTGTVLERDYNDGNGIQPLPIGLNKNGTVRLYSNNEDGLGNELSVSLLLENASITMVGITFDSSNDKNPSKATLLLGSETFVLNNQDLLSSVIYDDISIESFSLINDFIGASSNQIWIKEIEIEYEVVTTVDPNTEEFTVTFVNGNDTTTKNVYKNMKVTPVSVSKPGYTFLGWFSNNTAFDFNTLVTSDITLEARWQENQTGENPSNNDPKILNYYSDLHALSGSQFETKLRNMIKTIGKAQGSTAQVKRVDTFQGQNYNIYDGFGSYGNREHVWPNSKLGNAPKYDLHNLRAAVVSTNSDRGNLPYGTGSGGWKKNSGSFYPGDEHIGDVARIILYVHLRYNLGLSVVGNLEMFLQWHQADPVSDFERSRNNLIQVEVGSRNPLIDYPEYISVLFSTQMQKSKAERLLNSIGIESFDIVEVVYVDFNSKREYAI